MTLNSSGPISLGGSTAGQSVNLELGFSATAQISFNDSAVRTLTGTTAGTTLIMPTNFYGKSNRVALSVTYTTNTSNVALNLAAISGYVSGKSDITVTVNSGIYLYSTSTATPALAFSNGTTGDTLTLVNNGYIMGQGGAGGTSDVSNPGFAGGNAISLSYNITINNTNASAYIGGGGGGGASSSNGGGGGAGAGNGGRGRGGSAAGTGGGVGAKGTNAVACCCGGGGGGGGRIFPGCGGAGASSSDAGYGGGAGGGGGGGGAGTAGGAANNASTYAGCNAGGGGGGWGATGGGSTSSNPGAVGGKAVALNGKTVTWTSGNTTRVWGAVS